MEMIILPLGPMTSPILVHWDLDGGSPPARTGSSGRLVDRLRITSKNRQPGSLACGERTSEHLRRDSVELGVQLQRGDEVLGARALEVHVAERIFGTEDVGQGDEAALGLTSTSTSSETRPIAMPATGALSGNTGVEQRSVDAQTDPIDVEPLELSASDT